MSEIVSPAEVLHFWFGELSDEDRWAKGDALDAKVTTRFGKTLEAAASGELWQWRTTTEGRLAEIIVLDQFSRHIHRNTAAAFATDPMALALAQTAVQLGADSEVADEKRHFFYMPMMHSESLKVHDMARTLFSTLGETLKHEEAHRAIIERFGRYPHRNAILGRQSTPEELAFLQEPNSSF